MNGHNKRIESWMKWPIPDFINGNDLYIDSNIIEIFTIMCANCRYGKMYLRKNAL